MRAGQTRNQELINTWQTQEASRNVKYTRGQFEKYWFIFNLGEKRKSLVYFIVQLLSEEGLNLTEVTEPCQLRQCMHRTIRDLKTKIWFLENTGKHVRSTLNEPCISSTQNHCVQRMKPTIHTFHTHYSITIYYKSLWLLLLLFRYKFRNARLYLHKGHSRIIFTAKSVTICSFYANCNQLWPSGNDFNENSHGILTSAEPWQNQQTPGVRSSPG